MKGYYDALDEFEGYDDESFKVSVKLGRSKGVSTGALLKVRILEQAKYNTLRLLGNQTRFDRWKRRRTLRNREKQKEKRLREIERRRI